MIYENVDGNLIISECSTYEANYKELRDGLSDVKNSLSSSDWNAETRTTVSDALQKLIEYCNEIIKKFETLRNVGSLIVDCKQLKSQIDSLNKQRTKQIILGGFASYGNTNPSGNTNLSGNTNPSGNNDIVDQYTRKIEELKKQLNSKDNEIKGLLGTDGV